MSTISVFVLSLDTRSERRFDPHLTIGQLKTKLESVTGIPVPNQEISLFNSDGDEEAIAVLGDDTKAIGFYGVRDFQTLKITDTNPSATFTGQLTDVTQVDKFELTPEEYAQRQDSVLAYKQRNKVGRFAVQEEKPAPAIPTVDIPVGSRCEVESSEPGLSKRGTVRFYGQTKFAKGEGVWVGVEYDEPMGKNDGSVQGDRYFTCRQNYGVFVRPDKVKVGDYPVEEIDLEDEEM
ncbi:hypothetical protein FIBSPDRAFT_908596 [Athelia psychrophila]|uniref:CAP-Gly domain-containing protein n=1 Tax=Athelia psychrophila TaxID=1759441 RepID=A0A166RUQ6_9AGAM|nr:hypothetical protein FIBSPDRAFT_908594 [Fibularhizoctonia sp. CBS 109695]KZP28685.1 hypothetical protein FIBSPDRAFT_908596 [Fibularhizoctonia sp. CBS 109695]